MATPYVATSTYSAQTPQQHNADAGYYAPPTAGSAIAALILVFFIPLVGLIVGYTARNEIDRSNGVKGGRGLALAAIALGWIFTLLAVIAAVGFVAYLTSLSSTYSS